MKRLILVLIVFLCFAYLSHAQNNIGINDNNSAAIASAMLDIYYSLYK